MTKFTLVGLLALFLALTASAQVCSMPDHYQGTLVPLNNACRGAAVYAVPGSVWLVALDHGDNRFEAARFILTFGAAANGKVSGKYVYLDSVSPVGKSFNWTIQGKSTGASLVPLNLDPNLFPLGAEVSIVQRFVDLTTGAVTLGGSYRLPQVGMAIRIQ
jgi:hypothetical protein